MDVGVGVWLLATVIFVLLLRRVFTTPTPTHTPEHTHTPIHTPTHKEPQHNASETPQQPQDQPLTSHAAPPSGIIQALKYWTELQPNKVLWSFVDDSGRVVDRISYHDTLLEAMAVASYLSSQGVVKGDRVLLVFLPCLQFTVALLGCFIAGVIAVPVFPPDPSRLSKELHQFALIQQNSGAVVVLSHAAYNSDSQRMTAIEALYTSENNGRKWTDLKWLVIDTVLKFAKLTSNNVNSVRLPPDGDIAFLQYTSGSTSDPKGVVIAHGNLCHNLSIVTEDLAADRNTIVVSWLPQYHDMGLIGSYLGILFCGGSGFYMSPYSFLRDPLLWLKCMSRFRATHTQAPSFAYALCARRFNALPHPSRPKIDLSCVRYMINAAEPVGSEALEAFYSAFASFCALGTDVVAPSYGLAEHTVFVCSGGRQRLFIDKEIMEKRNKITEVEKDSEDSQCIVGCGYPFRARGVELLIVDTETHTVLQEDSVGEIWLNSPSKAKGYWNPEEIMTDDFHAHPVGFNHEGHDGFLRTGDLGFLHSDELFICGRLKDLIIVRGSNHYPQDIERTAEVVHANLRPGCSAAFSVVASEMAANERIADKAQDKELEVVVLVSEVRELMWASEYRTIVEAIKKAVNVEHGVMLSHVLLLKPHTVCKTSSGKIARAWNKKAFLSGTINEHVVFWHRPLTSRGSGPHAVACSA